MQALVTNLLLIYLKYRKYFLQIVLFVLSVFIAFRIILPQIFTILETNQNIKSTQEEIKKLNDSLNILTSQSDSQVNDNLTLVGSALPFSKDVDLIFAALIRASNSSSTELREFSLKLGKVYGKKLTDTVQTKGIPFITVPALVSSPDPENFIQFSKEIQKIFPLAEVKKIATNKDRATFDIVFYYKPIDQSFISGQDKIPALSFSDQELLTKLKLREW